MTLAETIKQLGSEHLQIRYEQETDCFDPQSTWDKGTTIINFMKTVSEVWVKRRILSFLRDESFVL